MRKRIIAAALALTVLCTGALADFNDVPGDAWYAEAVSWAQENGIMTAWPRAYSNPTEL